MRVELIDTYIDRVYGLDSLMDFALLLEQARTALSEGEYLLLLSLLLRLSLPEAEDRRRLQ